MRSTSSYGGRAVAIGCHNLARTDASSDLGDSLRMPGGNMELSAKRIVVTGCASGMGAATVGAYVEAGAQVVGMDIADDAGSAVCSEANANGPGTAAYLSVDVADHARDCRLRAGLVGGVRDGSALTAAPAPPGGAGLAAALQPEPLDGFPLVGIVAEDRLCPLG